MTALTLKYRPKTFAEVIGQKSAVSVAQGFLAKGIPPTILISGPHACGKTTIARILARAANCEQPKDNEPCGVCDSCRAVVHPNIQEVNAAESRGIDTIRDLTNQARLAPIFTRRVIILDEAHAMTPQAYQAGLKLFEEPPDTTSFILVTTNPEKLPKTILSRCSSISVRRLPEFDLARHLARIGKKEGIRLGKDGAVKIAAASGGHPREALTMLQQLVGHGNVDDLDKAIKEVVDKAPTKLIEDFLAAVADGDAAACFKTYSHIESAEKFLEGVVEMLQAAIRYAVDPRMVQGYHGVVVKRLRLKRKMAAFLLETFGKAYQSTKNRVMDPDVILDLAIIEATEE